MSTRLLAVVPPIPEYGDRGPFEAAVMPHPLLYCDPCGHRLYQGETVTGATVYACMECRRVVDTRRVP